MKVIEKYEDIPASFTPYQRFSTKAVAHKAARGWTANGYNVVINRNDVWAGKHTGKYSWQLFIENF